MRRMLGVVLAGLSFVTPALAGGRGTERTIAYVQKLQQPSGAFLPVAPSEGKEPAPTLRATSSAIRTLHYLGGKLEKKDDCAKFVAGCFDADSGGYRDTPSAKPDVFTSAVGIIAAADLGLSEDRYIKPALQFLYKRAKTFDEIRIAAAAVERVKARCPVADGWIQTITASRNFDGSWGADFERARATASAVVAIMRLGGPVDNRPLVLTAIRTGQLDNGGFGKSEDSGDLESTYRVMRCLVMLDRAPSSLEGVRSFVAKCRNEDAGYGISPGAPSTLASTYYAAIILHWVRAIESKDQ